MTAANTQRAAEPEPVDLLVVGTGPVGAAFGRRVLAAVPGASVLLIDAGPQLTSAPGANIRNLPPDQRLALQARVSGDLPAGFRPMGARPVLARPGTTLVWPDDGTGNGQDGMPAAAISTNVGGMGAHWTCAVPRPGGSERIPFIPAAELDDALEAAEALLHATTAGFQPSPASGAVLAVLAGRYDHALPDGRRTGPMPLACTPAGSGLPAWSGADTVLGPAAGQLTIRQNTIATRLLADGDQVTGAELTDLASGRGYVVRARVIVVAADAFRTPRLLWASGIRPPALGRYLNDQPQVVVGARIDVPAEAGPGAGAPDLRDALTGVCWVPFADGVHPFHGQVMQLDASPVAIDDEREADPRPMVGLGWFLPKDIRPEDRVVFDDTDPDEHGQPGMRIEYALTDQDRQMVDRAAREASELADSLGERTREPLLLPAGSSLHYQGTTRMGPADDGTSVCDSYSRVWGFGNLFVGGNGVIPTATACNPTLTSVALAVRAAAQVAALLRSERSARGDVTAAAAGEAR